MDSSSAMRMNMASDNRRAWLAARRPAGACGEDRDEDDVVDPEDDLEERSALPARSSLRTGRPSEASESQDVMVRV